MEAFVYNQRQASNPAISAWVSASAGSGKTKVLTDRVLRLLLGGARPAKILCLTYTKAAAAEMAQRVRAELGRWAIIDDAALQRTLEALTGAPAPPALHARARHLFARLIDAADTMPIQTMHGFCQSVLKRFPLEAGVAPHFSLIDERTNEELLGQARLHILTHTHGGMEALRFLTRRLSEASFDALLSLLIKERKRFVPWLSERVQGADMRGFFFSELNLDANEDEVVLFTRHFLRSDAETQQLRALYAAFGDDSGSKTRDAGPGLSQAFDHLPAQRENYLRLLLKSDQTPRALGAKKYWERHPEQHAIFLKEQARAERYVKTLKDRGGAELSAAVAELARSLFGVYEQLKYVHHYLDYDDLIAYTLRLLQQDQVMAWVLYKLDGGINHLLIDEAQDTSPEQWQLIRALCTEFFAGLGREGDATLPAGRTLFVVGDEKQSIFSFQGAVAPLFAFMREEMARKSASAERPFARVRLERSFRSTIAVLQAVDDIFAYDEVKEGVAFDEQSIQHEAHRSGSEGQVEIWPLFEAETAEEHLPWQAPGGAYTPDAASLAAIAIADKIAGWLRNQERLVSKNRPMQPGDILLLVQKRGRFFDTLLRALKRRGVPVAGADRLVLGQHIAVQDCLALADFLLLPEDDLTLAIVLKSAFLGISEEALFALAHGRGQASLWQRLQQDDAHRAEATFLRAMLAVTDYLPPYELFAHAFETLGKRAALIQRLGEESRDPLEEFLSLALEYERMHPPTLQGFIAWLRGSDTAIKRDMEHGGSQVRLMTVHGAKGLQAPIVFLADAATPPSAASGGISPLFWADTTKSGLPMWANDGLKATAYDTARGKDAASRSQEYRRLLYVALTRAEDRLYICGWKPKKSLNVPTWHALAERAARERLDAPGGWRLEEGKYILSSPQIDAVSPALPPALALPLNVPEWLDAPAPGEPPLPHPLAPSHLGEEGAPLSPVSGALVRWRGTVIHQLLQYLPSMPGVEREAAAWGFVKKQERALPAPLADSARETMVQTTLRLLDHPEFHALFSADANAEVEVSGVIQENGDPLAVAGRIDRLVVQGDEVTIIDYKTTEYPPESLSRVPLSYIRQMRAYRALLMQIYPGKTIRTVLLWTSGPSLMEVG